jgi:hypothetical protein
VGQNSRNRRISQTKNGVRLSGTQIRRLPKPRSGFELPAQQLIALVAERPDVLVVKGFDFSSTPAKLAQYAAMTKVVRDKKLDFQMAADAQLLLGSDLWLTLLVAYQHAKAAARTDPEVAAAIAPFAAFMKKRRGKRKAKQAKRVAA